jgi:hypothetical protein
MGLWSRLRLDGPRRGDRHRSALLIALDLGSAEADDGVFEERSQLAVFAVPSRDQGHADRRDD